MPRIIYIAIMVLAFILGLPVALALGEADNATATVVVSATPAIAPSPPPWGDGGAPLPRPAIFSVSRLEISPAEAEIGSTITISILVENTGGKKGTCQVTLIINGEVEESKDVVVDADTSTTVTFTTSRDSPGTYSVEVNGLVGSFRVEAKPTPTPPPITPPEVPPAPTPPEVPPVPTPPESLPVPAKEVNWPLIGGITGAVAIGVLTFFLRRRV